MKSLVALMIALSAGAGLTADTALAQQTARSDWFAGIIKCHSAEEKLDVSVFVPVSSIDTDNGKLILESSAGARIPSLLLDGVKVLASGDTITADAVVWDTTTQRKIKLEARTLEMNDRMEIPATLDLDDLDDFEIVSPGTRTVPMVCRMLMGC